MDRILLRLNLRATMPPAFRGPKSATGRRCIAPRLILFLLAAISCGTAFAQASKRTLAQYVHTAWGEKEGAPKNIRAFAQTPDGFLWIGAADGLTRFDGVSFEHYEPASGPKLPVGQVFSLLALPNGDLWIGYSNGGISLLKAGRAVNYAVPAGLAGTRVRSLARDGAGTLWAATTSGLARLEGDRWIEVGKDWNPPAGPLWDVFVDRKGTLWATNEHVIAFLLKGSRTFQTISSRVGLVPQIAEAPSGKLWIAEATRSVRPMPLETETKSLPPDDTEVRVGSGSILFAPDGALWIATLGDGVRRVAAPEELRGKPDKSSTAMQAFTEKEGLTQNFVLRVFQDREGNIWAGTLSGLDRFRPGSFTPLVSSISTHSSWLVPAEDGDIWILGIFARGPALVHESAVSLSPFAVSSLLRTLNGFYRNPTGAIWWVTAKALLHSQKNQFVEFPLPAGLADNRHIDTHPAALSEDRSGVLWMAIEQEGLFYRKGEVWSRFDIPPELRKVTPTAAYTDDGGRVWVGFEEGAIVYLEDGAIQTVATAHDSPVGNVSAIRGRGQQVWIGGTSGVAYFDGKRLLPVVPSDAPSFQTSGMEQTADGSLWLREQRGAVHIGPEELHKFLASPTYRVHYELFNSLDGLPGIFDATARHGETLATNGRLWFAATNGFASLDPARIPRNSPPPQASIRAVIADGKPVPSQNHPILPPLVGRLEVDYSGLNLATPERVRYRYLLEGTDKDWQDAGVRREAFYTNLGPGKHRFHLSARNVGGEWNAQDTVLEFSIAPAWFQTAWFVALCTAVALILLWALYRMRVHQVAKAMSARFDERLAERTRIARDLHDTFLQTIQGSKLVVDVALKQSPDPTPMRSAMEQVSVWLGRATEEGRAALNSLRTSATERNDLAAAFQRAIEECRIQRSMHTSFSVVGEVSEMHPIVRDEVYRIGYEAIRNACAHSQATHLQVELTYAEDLLLRVGDNGVGIDPAIVGDGREGHFGLTGMRERASRIMSRLSVETSALSGTEIKLVVPGSIIYRKTVSTPRKRSAIRSLLERMGLVE